MSNGTFHKIETNPTAPHPLGRSIVWHDPRNRLYRAIPLGAEPAPDRTWYWYSSDVFDQQGSSCTAQSAVGVLRSTPYRTAFKPHWPKFDTEEERHAAYLRAQLLDSWPGAEPDYEGTSTDAPFKLLRDEGVITGWRWLFGFHDVKQWVMHRGPVSVGSLWYNSMFETTSDGWLKIDASQGIGGGHAWAVVGYSNVRHAFRMVNSWSKSWGQRGRAWIHEDDLGRLLAEEGEAVTCELG